MLKKVKRKMTDTIYKEFYYPIIINARNRQNETLTLTFQSYDERVAKLILELQTENDTVLPLDGATVRFYLTFEMNGEQKSREVIGAVESIADQTISLAFPDDLKDFVGTITAGVYIDFNNGQKMDVRNLIFSVERSLIDAGDYGEVPDHYFESFQAVLTDVTNHGTTSKSSMDSKVTEVNTYGDAQKSSMDSKVSEVNTYATTQKSAINGIVSDVQTTGNTAKTQIGQVLPDVQADVAELQSDLNDIKSNVVSIDALNTKVDNIDTKVDNIDSRLTAEESNVSTLNTEVADLELYVGYTKSDIYGVEVDMVNRRFTRLAGSVGKNGGSDFDNVKALGGRRRCSITNDGVVLAYYGDSNYTESGFTTAEIVKNNVTYPVGTPVQALVEQPKFYYKVVPLSLEPIANGKGYHMRKARYYISDYPKVGFKVHPAFVRNGVEHDKIYVPAYDGCLYDASTGNYVLNDEQIADFDNDMLSSTAGAKPVSGLTQNLTRANARKLAHNRGNGWEQQTIQTVSLTQLLFLIEYNTFNTQAILGMGATQKTDDGSSNLAENTGGTSSLGNASGAVTNSNGIQIVSYRGEENPFGNIWKFVDGINVMAKGIHEAYVADHDFSDKQNSGSYADVGFTLAKTNGYVSAFGYSQDFDWLFLTSETTGNSSVPVGDYFWQNYTATDDGGWRTVLLGAGWNDNSYAGGFYWKVDSPSFNQFRGLSTRLVYLGGGN